MDHEDEYFEISDKLNDLLDEHSPAEKHQIWKYWYGNRLVETLRSMGEGMSFLEAHWRAQGKVRIKDRVYEVDGVVFGDLREIARSQPEAFDLIKQICASRLRANAELSKEQGLVVAKILQGGLTRPKRPGRPRAGNWSRDILIYEGVTSALRCQLNLERSASSTTPCAFSVVVEAFNNTGQRMVTYATVRGVWRNRKDSGLENEIHTLGLAAATFQLGDDIWSLP
jgi:hypothetical protein